MNIKSLFSLVALIIATFSYSNAQEIAKRISSIDATTAFGKDIYSGAVSWNQTFGLGSANKFRIGYGARLSTAQGSNLIFTTAPAKLAADLTKVDTLTLANASPIALNALINLGYQFSSKFKVGFNIDAIGIGFGSNTSTKFTSSDNTNGQYPTTLDAKPTSTNLLLVGNNDIGQLKSELYGAYAVSAKLWLKGGLDFTFSEYTTSRKLIQDNDRFRNKSMMLLLGISYVF